MSKSKILFLNPPGKKIYIRDYYCSKVSKAYYLPQPVDLLIQTSFFSEKTFQLKVIDAIVEQWSVQKCLKEVLVFEPDIVIGQIGSVSYDEDISFYQQIADVIQCEIFCSGDVLLEDHEVHFQEHLWLKGIITDFYKPGVFQYIEKEERINGLVLRDNSKYTQNSNNKNTNFSVPKHSLFNNKKYRMPFMTSSPMATVLTNYACPFPCTFCIMSKLEYKTRSTADIIEELVQLKEIGVKFIYFSDQTFYISPKVMDEVLDYMQTNEMGFQWMCFSRVDILNEQRMMRMKKTGCQLIMFGVEWSDDNYLAKYKKNYTTRQVEYAFELTKKIGIKTLGTFLIGIPGQTEKSIRETFDFAIKIRADYASFNVAVPRSQTSFRDEAIQRNLIDASNKSMDQSGSFVIMGTGEVSQKELEKIKKEGYRRFYLRPSYLLNRLRSLRNLQELKNHLYEGWYVLKSNMFNS